MDWVAPSLVTALVTYALTNGPAHWTRYWRARGEEAYVRGWCDGLVEHAGDVLAGFKHARERRRRDSGPTPNPATGRGLGPVLPVPSGPSGPTAAYVEPEPSVRSVPKLEPSLDECSSTGPSKFVPEPEHPVPIPPARPEAEPVATPRGALTEDERIEESIVARRLAQEDFPVDVAFAVAFASFVVYKLLVSLLRRGVIAKEALRSADRFFDKLTCLSFLGTLFSLLFDRDGKLMKMVTATLHALRLADRIDAAEELQASARPGLGYSEAEDAAWLVQYRRLVVRHRWLIIVCLVLVLLAVSWAHAENWTLRWRIPDVAKVMPALNSTGDEEFVERAVVDTVVKPKAASRKSVVDEPATAKERPLPKPVERDPSGPGVSVGRKNIGKASKPEMATGNPVLDTSRVVIPIYGSEGQRIGWACHVKHDGKTFVLTVKHVVAGGSFWDAAKKMPVAVQKVWRTFPEYDDALVVLETSSAKIALPRAVELERVDTIHQVAVQCGTLIATGYCHAKEGQAFVHNASTQGGWSGAPIFAALEGDSSRYALVAIHHGAMPQKGVNVGLPFFE